MSKPRIENKTVLTRKLLANFSIANLLHRLRFNIVIFPLLMIASAIILVQSDPDYRSFAMILVTVSVAIPIFIVALNLIMFNARMRNYPEKGKTMRLAFAEDGFYLNSSEENEVYVEYAYIKECMEFRKMYVIYFKGANPIIVEKNGFPYGDHRPFKQMMKKVLGKKSK